MKILVYGTLLRGEPNHHRLARATFVGPGRTRAAYRMISFGAFPAICAGGSTVIEGEVFEVDARTLADLDRLEGHPRFYRRTKIVLEDGTNVEAYILVRTPNDSVSEISSGSWRMRPAVPFVVDENDDWYEDEDEEDGR